MIRINAALTSMSYGCHNVLCLFLTRFWYQVYMYFLHEGALLNNTSPKVHSNTLVETTAYVLGN